MSYPSPDSLPLALGTVQIGLDYGLANTSGLPDAAVAQAILDQAWAEGIGVFDTARAYGVAEDRIGAWARSRGVCPDVITKVPALNGADPADQIRAAWDASTSALDGTTVKGLLLHRATDLNLPGVASALEDMVVQGSVAGIGVSVYEPDELTSALEVDAVTMVQLPASILDNRFLKADLFERCQVQGVAVYIRSAYLQGAVLMSPDDLPDHLRALAGPLKKLRGLGADLGLPMAALALQYLAAIAPAATLVIGADSPDQLAETAALFRGYRDHGLPLDAIVAVVEAIPCEAINPRYWPK